MNFTQLVDRFSRLPRSQRALAFVILCFLILLGCYFLLISPTMSDIETAQGQNEELARKLDDARRRASNRADFEAELEDLNIKLKKALRELPDDREIPGLLSEIDTHARKAGLEVKRFQPLAEVMHEYYAEVPVQIAMDGGYHEVALFFDRVSKMSRIVSVKDITMGQAKEDGGETVLSVQGRAVTYRFLTESEIQRARAEKEKEKDKKNKKKAGGGE